MELTVQQQKQIISHILSTTPKLAIENMGVLRLIGELKNCLDIDDSQSEQGSMTMIGVIRATNLMLANLENIPSAAPIIAHYKRMGLYRMLYRYPKHLGEEWSNVKPRKLLWGGFAGVGMAGIITAAFIASIVLGAPFWAIALCTGLFVGASAYVGGLLYGIFNDEMATRSNLPYFLLGHFYSQKSVLKTNDRFANANAWGVLATLSLVAPASILFMVVGLAVAYTAPSATFVITCMMLVMPIIAVVADRLARRYAKQKVKTLNPDTIIGHSFYQQAGLQFMSPTQHDRAKWYANSYRNGLGYAYVPLTAVLGLITYGVVSGLAKETAFAFLSSSLTTMIIPAAVTGAVVLLLAMSGLYTYVNRNKHVDNRYNSDFTPGAKINYNLYVDEDLPLVNQVLGTSFRVEKPRTSQATEVLLRFKSTTNTTSSSTASSNDTTVNNDDSELVVPALTSASTAQQQQAF